MKGFRIKIYIRLFFVAICGACLCLPVVSSADVEIEKVYPHNGRIGKELPVTVMGMDITADTRLAMNMDVKTATIGRIGGYCRNVFIADNTAYLCTIESVDIYDIRNPSQPVLLSTVTTSDRPLNIAVSERFAYVADLSGLQVIDIQNLENPRLLGYIKLHGTIWALSLSGNFVYVAAGNAGLHVVDVTEPNEPRYITTLPQISEPKDISVKDGIAYVADTGDSHGMYCVDITTPSTPVVLGHFATAENFVFSVTVSGDHAYLTEYEKLHIIDIRNPEAPVLVQSVSLGMALLDVALNENGAYVLGAATGNVVAVDVNDAEHPRVLWSAATETGLAFDIDVYENRAYVCTELNGFFILDIQNPAKEMHIGAVKSSAAVDIVLNDDTAYIADTQEGMLTIDVRDPSRPVLKNALKTPGTPWKIIINTSFAYIADGTSGIQIVDITDILHPFIVTSIELTNCMSLFYANRCLFACDWNTGLYSYDLENPKRPVINAHIPLDGNITGVWVSEDKAYVTAWRSGIHIVDVSNPGNLVRLGTIDIATSAYDAVAVYGNTAYMADDSGNLQLVDITDPAQPKTIGAAGHPGFVTKVALSGKWIYVACAGAGIQMIDVENPAMPILAGHVNTEYAWDIAIKDNMAYLADDRAGMVIVPLPVEIIPDIVIDENTLLATLPSPILPGEYKIKLFNSEYRSQSSYRVTFTNEAENIQPPSEDNCECFVSIVSAF